MPRTLPMLVSRRKMLEWTASSIMASQQGPTLAQYLRLKWTSPVFAVAFVWLIDAVNPAALPSMLPFAALWFLSPAIAWWWSQTPQSRVYTPQPSQP